MSYPRLIVAQEVMVQQASDMDTYEMAKAEKERVMSDAVLIAYAVVAIQGRVEDEVSQSEAYRLYDRGWVKDRTKRGMLHFSRKGANGNSARIYSRFEIEALKRAEKRVEQAYIDAERKEKELKQLLNQ